MKIECIDCGRITEINVSLYGAQAPSIITVLEWIIKELKKMDKEREQ